LLAVALLMAAAPSWPQAVSDAPKPTTEAETYQLKAQQYARARRAFDDEARAYWRSIVEKRQARNAKRRNNEPILLDDYVLTQPPVYHGPPRPQDPSAPKPGPRLQGAKQLAAAF
jgi:hypothetical protein